MPLLDEDVEPTAVDLAMPHVLGMDAPWFWLLVVPRKSSRLSTKVSRRQTRCALPTPEALVCAFECGATCTATKCVLWLPGPCKWDTLWLFHPPCSVVLLESMCADVVCVHQEWF